MTSLRDSLIDRLGAPTYAMLHATTCDFLGVEVGVEPEFVDRMLADGLEKFDHPPENDE